MIHLSDRVVIVETFSSTFAYAATESSFHFIGENILD